jgi:formylglycine-generating enzyme required for sulfatase activity
MPHHDTLEHPRDGSLMVLVPAGPFLLGLPDDDLLADSHEKPQRLVELPAFWIDVYPVTNARFARFLDAGGYDREEWWSAEGWEWRRRTDTRAPALWGESGWDAPEQPAAGVSWYEADAYARWAGRRLPTDAEWEKAARGTDGRRYPWGDDWPGPRRANFDGALGRTSPVGLFPAGVSPYGCHDMAGNVNNWTADWYWPEFGRYCVENHLLRGPLLDDALRARIGDETIVEKVDRGGGFATPMLYHEVLGCTRKVHWPPQAREPWNGFRTAVDEPWESGSVRG